MKLRWTIVVAGGALIGAVALALWRLGNPPNMGFCTACFERDIAGALGLHGAAVVQYLRPEIFGVLIGAFALSHVRGEFLPRGGSAPITMFFLGAFMMVGALLFLGCPLRMWQRIGAGDLNGLVGLAGLVAGVYGGTLLQRIAFDLPNAKNQKDLEGYFFPVVGIVVFGLFLAGSAGAGFLDIFRESSKGPGALHPGGPKSPVSGVAGILLSVGGGILVGIIGQYTRFCTTGSIRDAIFSRSRARLFAVIAVAVMFGVGTAIFGGFRLGFAEQPIAHDEHVWNFLGLALVGLTGVIMTGCPLRQVIRAAGGDSDAAMATLGLLAGAAFAHNFGLASSPKGVPLAGKVVVIGGILVVVLAGILGWGRKRKATPP
ncbi:MAG: YedE family putative selenium transporter [Planctomycetota bacterium]|jgi:YedE family putative selenium metabolism protein